MNNIGLVLEGGGMRGAYTAGVLDAFLDEGIEIPYVIGVSSGATVGSSYVTKQKERCKRIYIEWSQDKRFVGIHNFLKERSYFGMNFLFDQLPNELEVFDYDAFKSSETVFISCLSNCETGEVEYMTSEELCPRFYMTDVIRACNSLPIISPHVKINNQRYLDGFLTNPLPLAKSIEDGNKYNIVILTKKPGVEQKVSWSDKLFKNMTIAKYPKIGANIDQTVDEYMKCLDNLKELEAKGEVFLFRPEESRLTNRYGRNPKALEEVYNDGYDQAVSEMKRLKTWIDNIENSNQ